MAIEIDGLPINSMVIFHGYATIARGYKSHIDGVWIYNNNNIYNNIQ